MAREPKQKDVRFGLIGAGRWGRTIIETVKRIDGMTLTRVGSSNPATPDIVPEGCAVVDDYYEVLDMDAVDAVIVASPAKTHKEYTKRAIAMGLPVFVEKPMTLSSEEAAVLKRALAVTSGLVMVDHTHLYSPAFTAVAELAGAVGPIRFLRGTGGDPDAKDRVDHSVLFDWGAHDVAMALALMGGQPTEVGGERLRTCGPGGETIRIDLGFPEGAKGEFTIGTCLDEKTRRLEVHTDRVVLVLDDLAAHKVTLHPPTEGFASPTGPGESVEVHDIAPLDVALITFANAVNMQEEDASQVELGADVVAVLENVAARVGAVQ